MDLVIVIPCFNEADRLNTPAYAAFLKENPQVGLVMVDDGSTDATLSILTRVEQDFSAQVKLLSSKKNKGKAEAVRAGVHLAFDIFSFEKIAYLDADLSTSLEECLKISKLVSNETHFVFGSRISTIDNTIKRKWYRHYLGRIIATAISKSLQLTVYDTQCGCKIFEASLAKKLFKDTFLSRWLFDVELFHRAIKLYGRENIPEHLKEIPLNSWVATEGSKVRFSYIFKLWYDLFTITLFYRK